MDYGNLLSRAWRIVWENKILILVDFLAAIGSAGIGRVDFSYTFGGEEWPFRYGYEFERFVDSYWPFFIALACGLVVLGILVWLLGLASQAGLIHAVNRIDQGERIGFRATMSAGFRKLGRMAGINLILFAPVLAIGLFLLVVGIFVAVIVIDQSGYGMYNGQSEQVLSVLSVLCACLCLPLCLWLPLLLLASVIYPFAQRSAIVDDRGVWASIKEGWRFLRQNIGPVTVLGLIFLAFGVLFAIIAGVIFVPLGLLVITPWSLGGVSGQELLVGRTFFGLAALAVAAVLAAALNAWLVAFRSATVTLAYKELTAKAAAPQ